jgi:hypothetical protein
MPIGTRYKDPDATRRYTIDWTRWLASQAPNETLAESDWIIPDGLTMNDHNHEPYKTIVWISGGTLGATYSVINRIITSDGQVQDATIELIMEHK